MVFLVLVTLLAGDVIEFFESTFTINLDVAVVYLPNLVYIVDEVVIANISSFGGCCFL
jgi:flagellar biosynthesis protein FliQ